MISETHSRCIQSIKNYEESVGSLQQPLALIGFLEVCQFFPTVKCQSRGIGRSVPRGAVVHSLNTSVQPNQTPTPHPNSAAKCLWHQLFLHLFKNTTMPNFLWLVAMGGWGDGGHHHHSRPTTTITPPEWAPTTLVQSL